MIVDQSSDRRSARSVAEKGGTPSSQSGNSQYMSVRPARSCADVDAASPNGGGALQHVGRFDPTVDFERYRGPATIRFIKMARSVGQHTFHDLDDRAQEFYADFWADWLKRPDREFNGAPVPYIAGAMMNKLRQLNGRGRSVRPTEVLRAEGDEILATIATEDLEPAEQVVLQEEMWQVNEILHSLPVREQVVFAAVFGRDSKKKGSPPAGYKLAAQQLGVSEVRAKKLSLAANKRIRAAVEQVESGHWCERWAESIEQVAGGGEADEDFVRHAEHCVHCRLGVVHLRRQAAILPLPALALGAHTHLLGRIWAQLRSSWNNAREQVGLAVGRHGGTAADAGGIVTGSGGAAGAGITALKVGAVCLSVGLAGGAASVCLRAAGLPSPVIEALAGSAHARRHRAPHTTPRAITATTSTTLAQRVIIPRVHTIASSSTNTKRQPLPPPKRSSASSQTAARRAVSEVETEFNPGGGVGTQKGSGGSGTATTSSVNNATASSTTPAASTTTSTKTSTPAHHSTSSTTGATSGHSNAFSAP
jgi:hypothetical protein